MKIDYPGTHASTYGKHEAYGNFSTQNINQKVRLMRQRLQDVASLGIPIACDINDSITYNYIADLISLGISDPTVSGSNSHAELVSGLSFPVAFGVDAEFGLSPVLNAIESASLGHHHFGISHEGLVAISRTRGNRYGLINLNTREDGLTRICTVEKAMENRGIRPVILLDCSVHGETFSMN